MSENNSNVVFSLDYSNRQLPKFPEELYNFKTTLIYLDISANPKLNLDETIQSLKQFTLLKQLKINIETGEEAKKIIDALPNLEILNDHPINEEEEEDDNENIEKRKKKNEINNINNNLVKQEIAQINFNIINKNSNGSKENNNNNKKINNINLNENNDKNIINNMTNNNSSININNNINNSLEKKILQNEDNKFEYILNKIKEYKEITQEKYDLIKNEYNKLMNNNIKTTLDICSYFNKVLINLIKDAQEKNNIEISCIKPLLEAQTQNENIRLNFEEKIASLQNSNKNNHSYVTIESFREKNKLIKTELNSINQDRRNTNNFNNNSVSCTNHFKKKYEKNNTTLKKPINKNEIRKNYSNNIKNISLNKNKNINNNENEKIEKINDKNITFSIDNYLSNKKLKRNKSYNKPIINNINNVNNKEKEKKKYKFTHKSLSKKKISNKQSFQQENVDTYSNTYTNVNTDYNNRLNVSNPTVILLNNTNASLQPQIVDNQNYNKNRIDNKYINKNYMLNDNSKNVVRTISTISNDNNYLSKYDILKNCQDNPTINSLLLQIEKTSENFEISKIFDGLNEQVNYEYNNIHTINLKNLLDIINQVYNLRGNRVKKEKLGALEKGTLEMDLMTYLKSKYGLKKLIIEWGLNILSSIKAYSRVNGEVCLFGLILRNELDEGSIDILFKIKETVDSILKPLYKYNNNIINNIKNNKEFMRENEWSTIAQILYNNDNHLRQRFQNKIYSFIKKLINNEKILEKSGMKILFGDFLNQLIMFNLRLRKKYLKNLITLFKIQDKERYGIINHEEFKSMLENLGLIQKEKFKEVTDFLIEIADKEGSGQITFNDIVVCFDNFYLDYQNENNNEEKMKLLDKINVLNLN